MTQNPSPRDPGPRVTRRLRIGAGVLAAAVLAAVLYATSAHTGKDIAGNRAMAASNDTAADPACPGARAKTLAMEPLAHGDVAALSISSLPRPMPDLKFVGPDGARTSLADFRGRTVLLNLWATWCVPCRREMPALDRLEAKLGSKDFAVVAVNIDTTRLDRPQAFLKAIGVANLAFYADSSAEVFQELQGSGKALGLPTTVLVDRNGCDIGVMAGPADWDSPEALALISAAKG